MRTKCFAIDCAWEDDAIHMDDALQRLRDHYRAVHPTKYLDLAGGSVGHNLEVWNRTVDEWIALTYQRSSDGVQRWGYILDYLDPGPDTVNVWMPEDVRLELQRQYDEWQNQRRSNSRSAPQPSTVTWDLVANDVLAQDATLDSGPTTVSEDPQYRPVIAPATTPRYRPGRRR